MPRAVKIVIARSPEEANRLGHQHRPAGARVETVRHLGPSKRVPAGQSRNIAWQRFAVVYEPDYRGSAGAHRRGKGRLR